MFIYNFKLNTKTIVKFSFIIIAIIITIFFLISTYKIISESFRVKDEIENPDIAYIKPDNYTNVLKSVYEDLDTYIGQKICFSGYVYRQIDFSETQFVLARDMVTSSSTQTLIVGFLCDYKNSKDFIDGTWVEIVGEITKGDYHGEIPIIKIQEIKQIEKPVEEYVVPPDNTYIPTAVIY